MAASFDRAQPVRRPDPGIERRPDPEADRFVERRPEPEPRARQYSAERRDPLLHATPRQAPIRGDDRWREPRDISPHNFGPERRGRSRDRFYEAPFRPKTFRTNFTPKCRTKTADII
jgi:hypothetical protein